MTIGHQDSKKLDILDILDILDTLDTSDTSDISDILDTSDTLGILLIGHTVLKDKRNKDTLDTRLYSRHTRSRWTNDTLDISDTFDIWPVEIKTH